MAVRIMLVEPSAQRRVEFVKCLKNSKFEVVKELEDIESAIQLFTEVRPEIVVMAITFATIGGIKAIGALHEFDKNVKIIISYTPQDRHLVMDAVRGGAVASVKKPFRADRVLKALAQAMSASDKHAGRQWTARLQARLVVRYKKADAGFFAKSTETVLQDISSNGAALLSTEKMREGEMLKLQVGLPGIGKIKTLARVKRVEKKRERLWELGMMFVDTPEKESKKIEEFIVRSLSKSQRDAPEQEQEEE
jgi:two-component system chemotaxis response regulator CheY